MKNFQYVSVNHILCINSYISVSNILLQLHNEMRKNACNKIFWFPN